MEPPPAPKAGGLKVAKPDRPWFYAVMSDTSLLDQANTALRQNDWTTAERLYRKLLTDDPDNRLALANLSAMLCQRGKPIEAETLLRPALSRLGDFSDGFLNLGFSLQNQRRLPEAADAYRQAIAVKPANTQAMNNLGAVLQDMGRFDEAVLVYRSALAINPAYIDVLTNLASALEILGRYAESEDTARNATSQAPENATAWFALGIALKGQKKYEEAEQIFLKALSMAPNHHEGWNNYGVLLKETGRLDEAIAAYRKSITMSPNYAKAHNNLGNVLKECRRLTEAVATLRHAVELSPHYAEAHMNLALTLLQAGDFPAGWQEYEWRWSANRTRPRYGEIPRWSGDPPTNGAVLIHAEQGLGDTIQFARFLPLIGTLGFPIVFEVPPQLRTLMAGLPRVAKVIGTGETFSNVTAQIPLMSLPLIMGLNAQNVPPPVSFHTPSDDKMEKWKRRLGGHGFKIGIAWQGNPGGKVDWGRSLPLAQMAKMGALPGVRLISLQKHHGLDQIAQLSPSVAIETLGDDFDSGEDAFLDSAAVMKCLDLVVVSDSSLAHLSGTLGVRTWVVLRNVPDWRWGMEGNSTPWYPSAKLFRQDRPGEWDDVMDKIMPELALLLPK